MCFQKYQYGAVNDKLHKGNKTDSRDKMSREAHLADLTPVHCLGGWWELCLCRRQAGHVLMSLGLSIQSVFLTSNVSLMDQKMLNSAMWRQLS